jgi:DNA-binding MltR family transcriptional regulator
MTADEKAPEGTASELNQDLYAELRGESERAAAIFGAAVLDELLRQVLVAFMVADQREVTELTREAGALGPFAARIRVAYALGLIGREERYDLDTIRRIRNRFAHRIRAPSFADDEMKGLCLSLEIGKRFLNEAQRQSPRDCFQASTAALAYSLAIRTLQVKRDRRGAHEG